MPTNSVRPSIAETSYRFFDRPLHPELFNPSVVGRVRSEDYVIAVGLCQGGHYLQVTHNGHTVTELTGPNSEVFSTQGTQQTFFFNEEELVLQADVPFKYCFAGHADEVDIGVFLKVQRELEMGAAKGFISHQFPSTNRFMPGPLSLVQVEGNKSMVVVNTFHTFPDDLVILRTQSLFDFSVEEEVKKLDFSEPKSEIGSENNSGIESQTESQSEPETDSQTLEDN